jgi:sensor histidine kinase YesM
VRLAALVRSLSTLQVFVLGSAFIIALYHLSIFLLRREDRSSLYLTIGCVMLIALLLGEGFYSVYGNNPQMPYMLLRRTDYMTFIWSPVVFGWLNQALLPQDVDKRVLKAFGLIGILSTLYVMATPVEVFMKSAFFDPVIALEMGYSLWVVARAAVRKREDSLLLLTSTLILALSIVHDILYNAGFLDNIVRLGPLYAYGFLIYLYLHSFILAKRFSKSFKDAQRLSGELTDTLAQLNASIQARIESELSFLRAQIKPHFLYNTLSMISSLITREPERAKEILLDLSDYLRESYRFTSPDGLVDLSEELRVVELYLNLVKARYKDRFEAVFDIDESVRLRVPMLSIQPLVENAVSHGIFDMPKGGAVEILVKKREGCVAISVRDNGKGIEQSKVDAILTGEGQAVGVGLANINRRLIQEYGRGLIVESSPGYGTTVEMLIPLREVDGECPSSQTP